MQKLEQTSIIATKVISLTSVTTKVQSYRQEEISFKQNGDSIKMTLQ